MPEANRELLSRAEAQHPTDRDRRDWGVEELLFANLGEELRVSLPDDVAVCATSVLVDEVAALLASISTPTP